MLLIYIILQIFRNKSLSFKNVEIDRYIEAVIKITFSIISLLFSKIKSFILI